MLADADEEEEVVGWISWMGTGVVCNWRIVWKWVASMGTKKLPKRIEDGGNRESGI